MVMEEETKTLCSVVWDPEEAYPWTDAEFVAAATGAGLVNLKGHRSVGGMRASIYNAMPEEGVARLVEFMEAFEKKH